ncbi:MAG: electron transport complex subunit E [Desulfobacteraceae bacterium]|nr:electron transport complex subunit E [Desulfobacteraceae bacterium]MBC2756045.1 electron transport complex subunit E [Desulfobacteraceae bacterium]
MPKTIVQEFTKGLWEELPPFRLVLGLCPVLGVTTTMENGLGMGIATTFVLFGSNFLVSLLRSIIPQKVRIACFIIIIASFVTIVELLMQAYAYPLYLKLGVFIPLIVVNCIVLGRAEAFAYKNKVSYSIADGLGIGIGFTLSLGALGAVRELLGNGSVTVWGDLSYNLSAAFPSYQPFSFMVQAPGAFICLGLMLCIINAVGD